MKLTNLLFGSLVCLFSCGQESPVENSPAPKVLNQSLKDFAGFPIGVATNLPALTKFPELEPIVKAEFNRLTVADFQMWASQPQQGVFNFERMDKMMKLAEDNKMQKWGHVLMWHEYGESVPWVKAFQGDSLAWENLVKTQITTLVSKYKGRIDAWEVVNEAVDNNGNIRNVDLPTTGSKPVGSVFNRKLGNDYIIRCFQYTRTADPNAKLFFNDYNLESVDVKRRTFLNIVEKLQKQKLIDGIGVQGHLSINTDISKFKQALRELAATGLLVQITELDVRVNPSNSTTYKLTDALLERQATKYKEIVEAYLECVPVAQRYGITFWNVTDADSFVAANDDALLFGKDFKKKPAYNAFLEAIKKSKL